MSRLRRSAGLVAFLLGILGAAGFAAPSAEAAPGRCQAGTGVTVVVDYGPLGRSTGIGCDPGGAGDPASRVVPAAGFPITYAAGQPFVCRIDGLPDAQAESCQQTPPTDAYWGLFWNDGKGGGWVYSSQGVASLEVPAGGSIGWRFQDGGDREVPGAAPNPPAPASTPSDSPSSPPSKPPSNGGGGSGSHTPQPTPTTSTPAPTPTASASARSQGGQKADGKADGKAADGKADGRTGKKDADGTKAGGKADESADPSPTSTDSPSDDATLAATEPTSSETDPGSDGWLVAVAVGAVVVLGGAAGVLAWRRRT